MTAREDLRLSCAAWRTSTYSGNGNECVEVASDAEARVLVRDTKNRRGPVLEFTAEPWKRFVAQVKADSL
jgi:hypothetical protein